MSTPDSSAACGHDPSDISFDRSICACGAMHYFCNVCGAQADPCHDEPAPAAAPVNGSAHIFALLAQEVRNLTERPEFSNYRVHVQTNDRRIVVTRVQVPDRD